VLVLEPFDSALSKEAVLAGVAPFVIRDAGGAPLIGIPAEAWEVHPATRSNIRESAISRGLARQYRSSMLLPSRATSRLKPSTSGGRSSVARRAAESAIGRRTKLADPSAHRIYISSSVVGGRHHNGPSGPAGM